MAKQILPNHSRYDFSGKARQEISTKIRYSGRYTRSILICTFALGHLFGPSQVCNVENMKFDHVFCNIICGFLAQIGHRVMVTKCINVIFVANRFLQHKC